MATIEAARLFPEAVEVTRAPGAESTTDATVASSTKAPESTKAFGPNDSAIDDDEEEGHGFRGFIRRLSHSFSYKPNPADVDRLVDMGFPRKLAERQLTACHGDVQQAAEYMVHAAHPPGPSEDQWNHPDCPICVREANNVRIANARRTSFTDVLARIRSRESAGDKQEEQQDRQRERRGSVGAMLRRPSISAALARMTSRDVQTVPAHRHGHHLNDPHVPASGAAAVATDGDHQHGAHHAAEAGHEHPQDAHHQHDIHHKGLDTHHQGADSASGALAQNGAHAPHSTHCTHDPNVPHQHPHGEPEDIPRLDH